MTGPPEPRPTGRRGGGPVVGAAVVLAVAVAALMIVQWAGDTDTAPFGPGSPADVLGAAGRAGLSLCSVVDEPDPLARQAVSSATARLAERCAGPDDDAVVVIDRFASRADRDAVARELTGRVRPRGSGVVYAWNDMTVLVRGDGDDAVRERLESVLRGSGAR